jgi:uncharacterized protein (PEP-CTERM system associated)
MAVAFADRGLAQVKTNPPTATNQPSAANPPSPSGPPYATNPLSPTNPSSTTNLPSVSNVPSATGAELEAAGGVGVFASSAVPPPFPSTTFGFAGAPATYRGAVPPPNQLPPLSANILLPPIAAGAVPVQAGDIRAPAFLLGSNIGLSEAFSDNPLNAPNHHAMAASVTDLSAAGLMSVDTARLQALANSSLDYERLSPEVRPGRLNMNLAAYGLGTVIPEFFFLDGRAAVTQLSTTGGVAFSNPRLIPTSEQTQVFVSSLSPIVRESFGNLIDADLRANLGVVSSDNGGVLASTPATLRTTSLADAQQERTTLTVAVGRGAGTAASRLTIDAANTDSQSVARSMQIRSFGDVQYQFNSAFAAISRLGYEDLRYPRARLAFNEPLFLIGGKVTLSQDTSGLLRFGRQDGFYGFDGALRLQVTPTLRVLLSHQHSVASSSEQILTNLNNSSLDPYGTIVDSSTALPSGLANPEFAYATTDLFRYQQSRFAVEQDAGRLDSFRLFGFVDHQVSLTGTSSNDTGKGLSFSWFRSMTPRLTSVVGLGYATHVGGGGTKTATVNLALNYSMTETLSGAARYDFIDSRSGRSVARANSFRTNMLELALKKSF